MQPSAKAFWVPKAGNSVEEYEDASAHSDHRFAIADGATESSFSERWAQELVKQFVVQPPEHIRNSKIPLKEWLDPLQKQWHASIPWQRLPWYAEEKARNGAFTSFLGVEITPAPSRFRLFDLFRRRKGTQWHAFTVGDSCFFQVRNDAVLKSFPFDKSEQFNNRPLLISSNPSRNKSVWKHIKQTEGACDVGDLFLLMTDALALWFMKENEAGRKPWKTLLEINTDKAFANFVETMRKSSALRNDDTTLLICHWKD
ncbi:MAG: protein phosphatase 2C domain-containing protein [Verrucomicrobia bacterium]|nr:protein phosphatase 2C domain-containing protein [Verrucomicrobiota bacterium]